MIQIRPLDTRGSAFGNRSDFGGQRFVILLAQTFIALAESLRYCTCQSFAGFLCDRLGKPVGLWIFYIETQVSCLLYHMSTFLYNSRVLH